MAWFQSVKIRLMLADFFMNQVADSADAVVGTMTFRFPERARKCAPPSISKVVPVTAVELAIKQMLAAKSSAVVAASNVRVKPGASRLSAGAMPTTRTLGASARASKSVAF